MAPLHAASDSQSCGDDLRSRSFAERIQPVRESLRGRFQKRPDPESLLKFFDDLLFDEFEGNGLRRMISEELGFRKIRFGRFGSFAWFTKTLTLPPIRERDLTREGLSSYAVGLIDYLFAMKGARLRWSLRLSAIEPVSFVMAFEPTAQRLNHMAYQIAGILDPGALRSAGPLSMAFSLGLFAIGLGSPPIQLFTPSQKAALDYVNRSETYKGVTRLVWRGKAAAHWVLARAALYARVALLVAAVSTASSFASMAGPLAHRHVNYKHAVHEAMKKPVDRDAETRELLTDLRADLESLEQELGNAPNKAEQERLQSTLDGVKAAIAQLESTLKPKIVVPPLPTS